jgi:hypothetical protein
MPMLAGLQGESATVCAWAGMHSDSSGRTMIACAILSGSLGNEVGVRQCAGVHGASSGCTLHLVDSSRFVNAKVGWYAKCLEWVYGGCRAWPTHGPDALGAVACVTVLWFCHLSSPHLAPAISVTNKCHVPSLSGNAFPPHDVVANGVP